MFAGNLWFIDASLWLSASVCTQHSPCFQISSPRAPGIRFRDHPHPVWLHLNLVTPAKILPLNKIIFTDSGYMWIWRGTLLNPVNAHTFILHGYGSHDFTFSGKWSCNSAVNSQLSRKQWIGKGEVKRSTLELNMLKWPKHGAGGQRARKAWWRGGVGTSMAKALFI